MVKYDLGQTFLFHMDQLFKKNAATARRISVKSEEGGGDGGGGGVCV